MSGATHNVFVIEDDAMMRSALDSMLRAVGFVPRFAPTAELAVLDPACAASDCLVVDIGLPGMSGLEFVERAQLREPQFARRVIFITARDAPEVHAAVRQLGACGLLCKPFPGRVLVDMVRTVVQRDAGERR